MYDWKCDGCGLFYKVILGFEFYSCKKDRIDWCHNCFYHVEEEKIITSRYDSSSNLLIYDTETYSKG